MVLPFANIGGDPEQKYFVDGVTESLTTDLSRISGSFVIGRNTAFTYKGKHVDLKQIGRELGVRYVLEGSVQRGRDRLRVNVQLIDAGTGNHLWAERFDKPVADLFDMQDEIVARLANALNTQLRHPSSNDRTQCLNRPGVLVSPYCSYAGGVMRRRKFIAVLGGAAVVAGDVPMMVWAFSNVLWRRRRGLLTSR